MSIDVIEQIKPLLLFDSKDDFYYLQILQRKKENPEIGSNSRVIKNYYIRSIEHLELHYDEIKSLCNQFNARASLRLNKRSFRAVAFKAMQNIANTMCNGDYEAIRNSYDRACGATHNEDYKKWIIDIDGEVDFDYLYNMNECIEECDPIIGKKVIISLPTKNGVHLISSPFNIEQFRKQYPDIDIHKDNPINLYIP